MLPLSAVLSSPLCLALSASVSYTHKYPFRLSIHTFLSFVSHGVVSCLVFRWLHEQVRSAKAEVVSISKIEPIESVDVSILFAI